MKVSIFYFVLLFSFGYQDSIPDQIDAAIEQIRDVIPETITISPVNLDAPDNKYLSGYLNISDINVKGIKEFAVNITYFLVVPTHFVITLDPITVDLDYLTDIVLLNSSLLHVFGEGKGRVVLTNFTIEANTVVSVVPLNLTINEMHMHLDKGVFTIDGLLNDDNFNEDIGELVSEYIAPIFNENEGALSSVLEEEINKAIADVINNSTSVANEEMYYEDHNEDHGYLGIDRLTEANENPIQILLTALASIITEYIEDITIDIDN